MRGAQGAESASEDTAAAPGAASVGAAAVSTEPGTSSDSGERPFRIVAVTSCPTGIAHTYMAAESLENAGREAGVEVVVEPQGSAGFTRLDPAVIAAADGVIFAHDVPVREKDRFGRQADRRRRCEGGHQPARRADHRGAREGGAR